MRKHFAGKRFVKNCIAACMAVFMMGGIIGSGTTAFAGGNVSFTDIEGHWAKESICALADSNVVSGYKQADGTYRYEPGKPVTRAEFVKIITDAYGVAKTNAAVPFADAKGHWAEVYIAIAAENGLTSGKSPTLFAPDEFLTREQMMTFNARALVKYKGYTLPDEEECDAVLMWFADEYDISEYAVASIALNVECDIVRGYMEDYGEMFLHPEANITRAEVAVIVNNSLHMPERDEGYYLAFPKVPTAETFINAQRAGTFLSPRNAIGMYLYESSDINGIEMAQYREALLAGGFNSYDEELLKQLNQYLDTTVYASIGDIGEDPDGNFGLDLYEISVYQKGNLFVATITLSEAGKAEWKDEMGTEENVPLLVLCLDKEKYRQYEEELLRALLPEAPTLDADSFYISFPDVPDFEKVTGISAVDISYPEDGTVVYRYTITNTYTDYVSEYMGTLLNEGFHLAEDYAVYDPDSQEIGIVFVKGKTYVRITETVDNRQEYVSIVCYQK